MKKIGLSWILALCLVLSGVVVGCGESKTGTLSFRELPTKLVYIKDRDVSVDVTGGKLTYSSPDGESEQVDLTAAMVSGFKRDTLGKQTLTVTYRDASTNFEITMKEPSAQRIEISTQITKRVYVLGQNLDTIGGVVKVFWDSGESTTTAIQLSMVSGYDNAKLGNQTLTVTYEGCEAEFSVTVKEKSALGAEIEAEPSKMDYFVGDTFVPAGLKLKLLYDDESTEVLPEDEHFSYEYDFSAVGNKNVKIIYGELFVNLQVNVQAVTISSIEVTTLPTKTEYVEGQKFSAAGMVVTAALSNGKTRILKADEFTYSDVPFAVGAESVTISTVAAPVKTATVPVTVVVRAISSIAVTEEPTKAEYVEGQKFLAAGMAVTATFNDGSSRVLTAAEYSFADTALTLSQTAVRLTLVSNDKVFADVSVHVITRAIDSISVKTNPVKLQYVGGIDAVDLTGGEIRILFNDGSEEVKPMTDPAFRVSGFENVGVSDSVEITVTHTGGKTATFTVGIIEGEVKGIALVFADDLLGTNESPLTAFPSIIEGQNLNVEKIYVKYNFTENETLFRYAALLAANTDYETTLGAGKHTLTVTFANRTAAASLEITAKSVTSIVFAGKIPDVTEGMAPDLTGLTLRAAWSNGLSTDVALSDAENDYDREVLTLGNRTVTFTFGKKTCQTTVVVLAKTVVELVLGDLLQTDYFVGDSFNRSVGTLAAQYNNGTEGSVKLSDAGISVSGFDSAKAGVQTVSFLFGGLTARCEVTLYATESGTGYASNLALNTPGVGAAPLGSETFVTVGGEGQQFFLMMNAEGTLAVKHAVDNVVFTFKTSPIAEGKFLAFVLNAQAAGLTVWAKEGYLYLSLKSDGLYLSEFPVGIDADAAETKILSAEEYDLCEDEFHTVSARIVGNSVFVQIDGMMRKHTLKTVMDLSGVTYATSYGGIVSNGVVSTILRYSQYLTIGEESNEILASIHAESLSLIAETAADAKYELDNILKYDFIVPNPFEREVSLLINGTAFDMNEEIWASGIGTFDFELTLSYQGEIVKSKSFVVKVSTPIFENAYYYVGGASNLESLPAEGQRLEACTLNGEGVATASGAFNFFRSPNAAGALPANGNYAYTRTTFKIEVPKVAAGTPLPASQTGMRMALVLKSTPAHYFAHYGQLLPNDGDTSISVGIFDDYVSVCLQAKIDGVNYKYVTHHTSCRLGLTGNQFHMIEAIVDSEKNTLNLMVDGTIALQIDKNFANYTVDVPWGSATGTPMDGALFNRIMAAAGYTSLQTFDCVTIVTEYQQGALSAGAEA